MIFLALLSQPPTCCRLFHEIVNGLLELRSVPTGTTLDQQQWEELQAHLEETAAADTAAAAAGTAAAAPQQQEQQQGAASTGAAAAQPQQGQGQQGVATLAKTNSFGLPISLPGSARHQRAHQRAGSIAASLRVGHVPAGSTDAGGGEGCSAAVVVVPVLCQHCNHS